MLHSSTFLKIILAFNLCLVACNNKKKSLSPVPDKTDPIIHSKISADHQQADLQRRDQVKDSLELVHILEAALDTLENINQNSKRLIQYVAGTNDSLLYVTVDIVRDIHFSNAASHALIRRFAQGTIYFDLYLKEMDVYQHVLAHEFNRITYMGDTIREINGDGIKDFVINWYGSSGCCLKGFSDVYLSRPRAGSFSSRFTFINPSFSPAEGIVRGIGYGHPGETEMYKYGWKGETIDTIETVEYEKNKMGKKTGKILVTQYPGAERVRKIKKLSAIPKEYRKIDDFDWFTGEW